jgi:ribonuclease Z
MVAKARLATHSTAEQAGRFARTVNASALVLTHFSARYDNPEKYVKQYKSALQMGSTIGELSTGAARALADEARAGMGGEGYVMPASDYFRFRVRRRDALPAEEAAAQAALEENEEKREMRARLEKELSGAARRRMGPPWQGQRQGPRKEAVAERP